MHKKYQDKKREYVQLKTTISELLTKKSRMEVYIDSIIMDESSSATSMSDITVAGNSFGNDKRKLARKAVIYDV